MSGPSSEDSLGEISVTSLASIIHGLFNGLIQDNDRRTLADAWRARLSVQTDEDLYEFMAVIRRMVNTLVLQVKHSQKIGEKVRHRHIELISALLDCTAIASFMNTALAFHQRVNPDRMHTLETIADVLVDEDRRPILPAEPVKEISDALLAIRADVEGSADFPPIFKINILDHIDKLLRALSMSAIFGSGVVMEAAIRLVAELHSAQPLDEESEKGAASICERLILQARGVVSFLDACGRAVARAKTAGSIGTCIAGLLSSPAL